MTDSENNTSRLRKQMAAALGFSLDALEPWQAIKLDVIVSLKIELASLLTKQESGTEIDVQRMIAVGEALDRQLNPAAEGSTRPVVFQVLPGEWESDGTEPAPADVQIARLKAQLAERDAEIECLRLALEQRTEPLQIEASPAPLALPAPTEPQAKPEPKRKPVEIIKDTRPQNEPWRSYIDSYPMTFAGQMRRWGQ